MTHIDSTNLSKHTLKIFLKIKREGVILLAGKCEFSTDMLNILT